MAVEILIGDVRERLRLLPAAYFDTEMARCRVDGVSSIQPVVSPARPSPPEHAEA